jgi:hypothetical protein
MRKDTTPRDMLLDRRVVDRNIKKGLVTREEYDKSLAALPDVADQAEEVRVRLGAEDEVDDIDDTDEDDIDDEEPDAEEESN